jgi:V8-like Glu-specific endopeptidase
MGKVKVYVLAGLLALLFTACHGLDTPPDASLDVQINFGQRDNGEHPYVGVLLFVQDGVGYYSCSGTLMSPTVMLTAAHCVEGASGEPNQVTYVRFTEEAMAGRSDYPSLQAWLDAEWILAEEVVAHPNYDDFRGFPDTYDIGLVLLSEPVVMATYGELAPLGYFDTTSNRELKRTRFEPVGYGLQHSAPPQSNRPLPPDDFARYKGVQSFINIGSAVGGDLNVKFTNNPGLGNGSGGTCSGDSGGPIFINDTNVIVAVNSYGIAPYCKGNDFAFRTDTQVAYDFVTPYLD